MTDLEQFKKWQKEVIRNKLQAILEIPDLENDDSADERIYKLKEIICALQIAMQEALNYIKIIDGDNL
jgi:hypothetical protein